MKTLTHLHNLIDEWYNVTRNYVFVTGAMACFGYLAYYYIWSLTGERYENLWLRASCGLVLFLPYITRVIPSLKRVESIIYILAITYALPFFFTFMLLKNEISPVWQNSFLAVTAIIMSWLSLDLLILVLPAGIMAGISVYLLTDGVGSIPSNVDTLRFLLTLPFLITFGILFSYYRSLLQSEREAVAEDHISHIVHEIKRPIAGIIQFLNSASMMRSYIQKKFNLHQSPIPSPEQSQTVLQEYEPIFNDLSLALDEARDARRIYTLFSLNSQRKVFANTRNRILEAEDTVLRALLHFPFKTPHEHERVKWKTRHNFNFVCDEDLIRYVLFNLLKNAIDATDHTPRPRIILKTLEPGSLGSGKRRHMGIIIIRDNGVGISSKEKDKIFKKFYTTKDAFYGTGIGLAFVKTVIDEYNGHIEVRSRPGVYTEFRLYLPAVKQKSDEDEGF